MIAWIVMLVAGVVMFAVGLPGLLLTREAKMLGRWFLVIVGGILLAALALAML